VAAVPIAQDDAGNMQRDYWYSVARSLTKLDPAEQVGKEALAARCAVWRTQSKNGTCSVVLDPMVAASMLEHIFEGINGDSVYRGASFLAGKAGRTNRGQQHYHYRRRHDGRRLWDLAFRRRGKSLRAARW